MDNTKLCHHGVKGQKWGVRRYQNKDGSLTPAGVKRYATKQYAKKAYEANETVGGKIYDKYTGAHKVSAKMKYEKSSTKKNEEAAKQYLEDKKNNPTKKKVAKTVRKGTEVAVKVMDKAGKAYLTDQIFFDGMGTKIAKEAAIQTGRAAVTAYTMARGGYDIRWYDKNGRRVG